METFTTALSVIGLIIVACLLAIAIVIGICRVGDRDITQQLDSDSPINYGRRHSDTPSHRCARRREDEVREAFLGECD